MRGPVRSVNDVLVEAKSRAELDIAKLKPHRSHNLHQTACRLYDLVNEVCPLELPPSSEVLMWSSHRKITDLGRTFGYFAVKLFSYIILSSKYIDSIQELCDTLLHEMVRAYHFVQGQHITGEKGHGPVFRALGKRILFKLKMHWCKIEDICGQVIKFDEKEIMRSGNTNK